MRSGEVEYEFNEGSANRSGGLTPREAEVILVGNRLAQLWRDYGQEAVNAAIWRAETLQDLHEKEVATQCLVMEGAPRG